MNDLLHTSEPAGDISSTSATLRLFFALEIPDVHRETIVNWRRNNIPWAIGPVVKPENFHITLAFLGACPAEQLTAITQAATKVQASSFDVHIGQLEYFTKSRVLCLAPHPVPEELLDLVEQLQTELRLLDFNFNQHYRPHLTLIRKAKHKPECAEEINVVMRATQFCLYRSVTDRGGVQYIKLNTWSLS